jgi:SHS2 domain-containing protein
MEAYPPFEHLEHTADVLVVAYGRSLEELYENAARGVFEIITDTGKVEARETRRVKTTGMDLEQLLYKRIEELLFLHETEGLVFGYFKVHTIEKQGEEYVLRATVGGEKFDESKHEYRTMVKAMTYAQMRIERLDGLWKASFVVDI